MHPILRFAKTAYIESHNLKPLLAGYTNPNELHIENGEIR